MKTLLILVTVLTSIQTLAGGSGGGGVLAASAPNKLEQKVRFVEANSDEITFDHAVKFQDEVKIQRMTAKVFELEDEAVIKALHKSFEKQSWENIQ